MIIQGIELTKAENDLLDNIKLDPSLLTDTNDTRRNGDAACALTLSLFEREAIPENRQRYFLDPEYNIGGRGSSRKDIFERNGVRGEEIFRHQHFLAHLRYFLYGAQLPKAIIEGFCEEVSACGVVTSGDIDHLSKFAKQQARAHHLELPGAAEEFYKLGLDCGLGQLYARMIRDAVKRLR